MNINICLDQTNCTCDTCIGQYECMKFIKIAYTCWIRHVVSMSKLVNTCNWNMNDK